MSNQAILIYGTSKIQSLHAMHNCLCLRINPVSIIFSFPHFLAMFSLDLQLCLRDNLYQVCSLFIKMN